MVSDFVSVQFALNTATPTFVVKKDCIVFANAAATVLIGRDPTNTGVSDWFQAGMEWQLFQPVELKIRNTRGEVIWLQGSVLPVVFDKQDAYLITGVDVTQDRVMKNGLRHNEDTSRIFQKRLKALHMVSIQLAQAASFDELCRQIIELGRSQLKFDRLGMWLWDEETGENIGTFGVDEQGNIRDERHQRVAFDLYPLTQINDDTHVYFKENASLYNHLNEVIGSGWVAMAYLQDGDRVIGTISVDNLLTQEPLEHYHLELIALYARTVSHVLTRKRMEQAIIESERLKVALQKEEELNSLKTNMMVRISHEFRTPLTIILNSTEIIDRHGDKLTLDQRSRHLKRIKDYVHRTAAMIGEVTMAVRSVVNRLEFRPAIFDLESLCRELIDDLVSRGTPETRIQFSMSGSTSTFAGDQHLIRVMLDNLLSNALKFSPPHMPVALDVALSASEVNLCVSDQGIGIPADEQGRIYEPFFRGSNVGETSGLGIGLRIVQEAAALHHGKIMLESEVGRGTKIMVALPILGPDCSPEQ
jgi:signal transduction histidine kinase